MSRKMTVDGMILTVLGFPTTLCRTIQCCLVGRAGPFALIFRGLRSRTSIVLTVEGLFWCTRFNRGTRPEGLPRGSTCLVGVVLSNNSAAIGAEILLARLVRSTTVAVLFRRNLCFLAVCFFFDFHPDGHLHRSPLWEPSRRAIILGGGPAGSNISSSVRELWW